LFAAKKAKKAKNNLGRIRMLDDTFHVYDTTLRDGAQQEGLNLSVADKLVIARQLDERRDPEGHRVLPPRGHRT
jgi:hypothetical protein